MTGEMLASVWQEYNQHGSNHKPITEGNTAVPAKGKRASEVHQTTFVKIVHSKKQK